MNCIEIQERIVDLIVGEIEPEEKELILQHINRCPTCAEDFYFISQCIDVCCSCPDFEVNDEYWEEFLVTVHEKISLTKPKKPFPYHIVLPLAGVIGALGVIYFLFLRPSSREIAQPQVPEIPSRDPIHEVYELTPEEQEEFIKMVNQKYFGE
ncbi:MAG: zf-HC2 domain-containing protein [candidate division WOR-3 bacterium]|nr:zf-HC2 domain-containing protein [candidate division WOR-3 bacterium]